jgi:hypothetical protein
MRGAAVSCLSAGSTSIVPASALLGAAAAEDIDSLPRRPSSSLTPPAASGLSVAICATLRRRVPLTKSSSPSSLESQRRGDAGALASCPEAGLDCRRPCRFCTSSASAAARSSRSRCCLSIVHPAGRVAAVPTVPPSRCHQQVQWLYFDVAPGSRRTSEIHNFRWFQTKTPTYCTRYNSNSLEWQQPGRSVQRRGLRLPPPTRLPPHLCRRKPTPTTPTTLNPPCPPPPPAHVLPRRAYMSSSCCW